MKPAAPLPSTSPAVEPALELARDGREAEAAALLEANPSRAGDDLHRRIATRTAHAALQRHDHATAAAWLDRGLARNPHDAALNFFRGNQFLDAGHAAEAVAAFRRCVAAEPGREEFVCNLGHALLALGNIDEAAAALGTLPGSAGARLNLGIAHERRRDLPAAAAAYEGAAKLQPELFEAWLNLGGVRDKLGDAPGAIAAYNRAVALRPASARAHLERGHVLNKLKHFDDAANAFERALKLEPANLEAELGRAAVRLRRCDWTGLDRTRETIVAPLLAALDGRKPFDPFFVLTLPGAATQAELRRVAADRARRIARDARPLRAGAAIARGRPLRIGYVSPDLGNHAVGNLLRTLFQRHDRARVSVHGFSLVRHADDAFRGGLRAGCDTWDDLDALADEPAARQIAAREIDVLVDLAGHTRDNRLELLAWRPAPVQATWLGYPGTTGAEYVDWLLADRTVIAPGEEAAFSERLHFLPGCYLPADDSFEPDPAPQPRAAHGLPERGAVFCAFNNGYKLEPQVFAAWMTILRRTPGAVLWLRGGGATAEANLRRAAESHEIDPRRLVFDARSLPRAQHLARHRAADLYLDTHFYNAHSTASDALWSGLPVLTCPGRTFASRVGASLVQTLGLADELVAAALDDYVERAVRLAAEPERLRAVRERLAHARTHGPLFATAAFARKLEDAYEAFAAAR